MRVCSAGLQGQLCLNVLKWLLGHWNEVFLLLREQVIWGDFVIDTPLHGAAVAAGTSVRGSTLRGAPRHGRSHSHGVLWVRIGLHDTPT